MTKIEKAMSFAAHRHAGQMYGQFPYVKHLQDVYELAVKFSLSENVKAAAWLHDTLEDTQTFTFELEEQFGTEIADLVYAVTGYGDNRKQRNADAMRKILENKEAAHLKICDRIANILECERTDKKKLKMYLKEHEGFSEIIFSLTNNDLPLLNAYNSLIYRLNLQK